MLSFNYLADSFLLLLFCAAFLPLGFRCICCWSFCFCSFGSLFFLPLLLLLLLLCFFLPSPSTSIHHPYPSSISIIHIHHPYPSSISIIHIHHPYPSSISIIHIHHPYPSSSSSSSSSPSPSPSPSSTLIHPHPSALTTTTTTTTTRRSRSQSLWPLESLTLQPLHQSSQALGARRCALTPNPLPSRFKPHQPQAMRNRGAHPTSATKAGKFQKHQQNEKSTSQNNLENAHYLSYILQWVLPDARGKCSANLVRGN